MKLTRLLKEGLIALFGIAVFILGHPLWGSWSEPKVLLHLTPGTELNQFGSITTDMGDEGGWSIALDARGRIVACDPFNQRIILLHKDGTIIRSFSKPSMVEAGWMGDWPTVFHAHPTAERILAGGMYNICIFDYEGNIVNCFPSPCHACYSTNWHSTTDMFVLHVSGQQWEIQGGKNHVRIVTDDYYGYDLEGTSLGKLSGRPAELGTCTAKNRGIRVELPGKEFDLPEKYCARGPYDVDADGNLFFLGAGDIKLYGKDGILIDSFQIPDSESGPPPEDPSDDFSQWWVTFGLIHVDSARNVYLVKTRDLGGSCEYEELLKYQWSPDPGGEQPAPGAPE